MPPEKFQPCITLTPTSSMKLGIDRFNMSNSLYKLKEKKQKGPQVKQLYSHSFENETVAPSSSSQWPLSASDSCSGADSLLSHKKKRTTRTQCNPKPSTVIILIIHTNAKHVFIQLHGTLQTLAGIRTQTHRVPKHCWAIIMSSVLSDCTTKFPNFFLYDHSYS